MDFKNRKDLVFIVLAGFFVTNAIVAELIGGKLIQFFGLFCGPSYLFLPI